MGLPVRQRRVLDRIDSGLRGSDPRLATLYAIFARLNRDEEMPRIEQLRHRLVLLGARLRCGLTALGAGTLGRLIPRQRALIFLPLALGLAVASVVLGIQSGSAPPCARVTPLAAASRNQPQSKLCKSTPQISYIGKLRFALSRQFQYLTAASSGWRQAAVPPRAAAPAAGQIVSNVTTLPELTLPPRPVRSAKKCGHGSPADDQTTLLVAML
jgi:hypothetical protein